MTIPAAPVQKFHWLKSICICIIITEDIIGTKMRLTKLKRDIVRVEDPRQSPPIIVQNWISWERTTIWRWVQTEEAQQKKQIIRLVRLRVNCPELCPLQFSESNTEEPFGSAVPGKQVDLAFDPALSWASEFVNKRRDVWFQIFFETSFKVFHTFLKAWGSRFLQQAHQHLPAKPRKNRGSPSSLTKAGPTQFSQFRLGPIFVGHA